MNIKNQTTAELLDLIDSASCEIVDRAKTRGVLVDELVRKNMVAIWGRLERIKKTAEEERI